MDGNAVSVSSIVVQAVGKPHLRFRFHVRFGRKVQAKARRQYANNLCVKLLARNHRMGEYGGVATIASLEVFITQNRHIRQARSWRAGLRATRRGGFLWHSVSVIKITTERDSSAYQAKEVRCDHCVADLLGRSILHRKNVATGENAS